MKHLIITLTLVLLGVSSLFSTENNYRTITASSNYSNSSVAKVSEQNSSEYAKLIREDRIWEYYDVYPSVHKVPNTGIKYYWMPRLIRVKFEGTEEINGKTYHILNSIYCRKDGGENGLREGITETYPLAYMREENGKVWMRRHPNTDNVEEYLGGFFKVGCNFGTTGIMGSTEEDYLIYDFSANRGEEINSLELFADPEAEYLRNLKYSPGIYELRTVSEQLTGKAADYCSGITGGYGWSHSRPQWISNVRWVGNKKFDEESKLQDTPEYHGTLKHQSTCWYEAIEGIGCLESGILCFPGRLRWCATNWTFNMYLNKVYDTDGNVLFENHQPGIVNLDTSVIEAGNRIIISGIDEISSETGFDYKNNEIKVDKAGKFSVQIFAADGRQMNNIDAENEINISTTEFSQGIYIVKIISENSIEQKKILVK